MKPPVLLSKDLSPRAARRFGRAWVALAFALALHVTDEALTDFLSVYNPTVHALRDRMPWLPLPTFSFPVWIAGLAAGIALLLLLSPLAFRGTKWITIVAVPFSILMTGNALLHLGSSIYFGRFMPGVNSSPLLLAASLFALLSALGLRKSVGQPIQPEATPASAAGDR